MHWRRTSTRLLATVTAAGVLAFGGATAVSAAEGEPGAATATAERPHRRAVVRAALRTAVGAAAEALGLTPEELRAQVLDGPQSIASVAGDRTGEVIDAVVAAWSARIDEAVAAGTLRPERAEQAKARLPEAAERFVNRVPGQRVR